MAKRDTAKHRVRATLTAAREYLRGKTSRQTYNRRIGQIWRRREVTT